MRHECQEILPGLLLGPFTASKSLKTLQALRITHMYFNGYCHASEPKLKYRNRVCIRDAKEAFSVKPRFPEQFIYMVLDVQDNEEQNLIRIFPQYVLLAVDSLLPFIYHATEQRNLLTKQLSKGVEFWFIVMVGSLLSISLFVINNAVNRRDKFIACLCCHVRNATPPTIMGRCLAYGAE